MDPVLIPAVGQANAGLINQFPGIAAVDVQLRQTPVRGAIDILESSAKIESEIGDVLQLCSNASGFDKEAVCRSGIVLKNRSNVPTFRTPYAGCGQKEYAWHRYGCMKLKFAAFPVVIPAVA